jgi:hypothetical protein
VLLFSKVAQIFVLLFSKVYRLRINFDKNWFGPHFGRFFRELNRSPWLTWLRGEETKTGNEPRNKNEKESTCSRTQKNCCLQLLVRMTASKNAHRKRRRRHARLIILANNRVTLFKTFHELWHNYQDILRNCTTNITNEAGATADMSPRIGFSQKCFWKSLQIRSTLPHNHTKHIHDWIIDKTNGMNKAVCGILSFTSHLEIR